MVRQIMCQLGLATWLVLVLQTNAQVGISYLPSLPPPSHRLTSLLSAFSAFSNLYKSYKTGHY